MNLFTPQIARELQLAPQAVEAVAQLLDEGATVPFIARYRKEKTGNLDEVAITAIRDGLAKAAELASRKDAILKSLAERNLLTDELKAAVEGASTMTALEDTYLPYRPKRRTRATAAREAGLEPLARLLFAQGEDDPQAAAAAFVSEEKGVADVEAALSGARDIIAEWISEDVKARQEMRGVFVRFGRCESTVVEAKKDEPEAATYQDYFDWSDSLRSVPSHRLLAALRGEREGYLSVRIRPSDQVALLTLRRLFIKGEGAASGQVTAAIEDSYKRLLGPSMENEARAMLKKRADTEAIAIFARNLRQLLMASPFGARAVLAVDPGVRTGCKVVALDATGALLAHDVIFIQRGADQLEKAAAIIRQLISKHSPLAVAVGNGTASRETVDFLNGLSLDIPVLVVSESGASVYSASEEARKELPDQDVTVRGAVSIGRRLMDPLAELVKIDPKAIGVGQYQHDVDQKQLRESLDDTVISCVNSVGVDLNTASPRLLSYVSGLSDKLARGIVAHREANGPFTSRSALLDVPRLGPKTYQQAAGFLRVRNSINPLDASAVHPENYKLVGQMASDCGCTVSELMKDRSKREMIDVNKYVSGDVGLPTLNDIMAELEKPGRDPRPTMVFFAFDPSVKTMKDLKTGMTLPGLVSNVTAFGAFVDVGVHTDGLVHVSQMGRPVKDPSQLLHPGQAVSVTVLDVDLKRNRISLALAKTKKDCPKNDAPTDAR